MNQLEFAGMAHAKIWPRSRTCQDGAGNRPDTIAFPKDLYNLAVETMEIWSRNVGNLTKDKFFSMDIVSDDTLPKGQWELRWSKWQQ